MIVVSRHLLRRRARSLAAARNETRRHAGIVAWSKYYAARRGPLRWFVVYDE